VDITGRKTTERGMHAAFQQLSATNQQLRATEQQLRASNQQLRATEQQLRASNQQLRATEQQLRGVVEQLTEAQVLARLGSWERDVVRDRLTGSDEMYRLFDVPPERLGTFEDFLGRLHPDDRVRVAGEIADAFSGSGRYDTEFRILLPDGGIRHLQSRGEVVRGDSGDVERFHGTCQDVTERKLAESALRASEARFRHIFEAANVGKSITLPSGEIDVNRALCDMLGYEPETLRHRTWMDITPPEDIEATRQRLEPLLRGELDSTRFDKRYLRADGTILWADVSVVLRRDAEGEPVHFITTIVDITHRRSALEALMQSEEKFSRAFHTSPYAITMTRASDGRFLEVNETFSTITGYTRMEALADSSIGLGLWADEADRDRVVATLAAGGRVFDEEIRFRRRSGEEIICSFSAQMLRFGGETCVLSSIDDVTERRRTVDALQRSREMLARTERIAGVGSWEWTIEGDVVTWSEEMFRIFRRDPALGAPSLAEHPEHYPPEDMKCLAEAVEAARTGGTPYDLELRFIRTDGDVGIGHAIGFAERDVAGNVVGLCGSFQDITARREAEIERELSEVSYRELFQNMRSGVAVYEVVDDGRDFVFRDFNRAAETIDGQRRGDVIGRSLSEARPGIEDFGLLEVLRRVRATGVPERFPAKLYRDNRLERWYDNTVFRLPDGKIVAMYDDLTDRMRAEEDRDRLRAQYLQAQKMESVGQLAGGVAHDFNNMLGVILGRTELALQDSDPDGPVAVNLLEIQKAAERSADLTRQLLAFARKQIISPRVLDLNGTVSGMLRMLQRLIGENIQLTLVPGANLWPVEMDPTQVDQVLANLCVNSRDAISGAGRIVIETSNQRVDEAWCAARTEATPGDYVLLAVSDDGCGMEGDVLEHAFEPFTTTKEVGKGTGLGLATVYGIVKQNGGFIHVHSVPGRGTTIRIYLPRHEGEPETPAGADAVSVPRGRGETVLLVEDEVSLRRTCGIFLEELGYAVLTAESPEMALEIADVHRPTIDLLLTDVIMPGINGRQLAERLRAGHPGMRVLFMSGYTADIIDRYGVLERGIPCLAKPFSRVELAVRLREVLDTAPPDVDP